MAKVGKKYKAAKAAAATKPQYALPEAVATVTKTAFAKFDETVEVAMRLGVDPKHADQMVRGTVILPHGLGGKAKKVLVIASGEKLKEAQDAGADYVGGDDMVKKIQEENWMDFDAVVATPDMMKSVGKLGKVLGPRGLMPNPKTGTVSFDVSKAVKEIKAGKVEYRVDNIYDLSPERHGLFDLVLFLGVLYHLRNPILALDNVIVTPHGLCFTDECLTGLARSAFAAAAALARGQVPQHIVNRDALAHPAFANLKV